jgi:hypothetical protein
MNAKLEGEERKQVQEKKNAANVLLFKPSDGAYESVRTSETKEQFVARREKIWTSDP